MAFLPLSRYRVEDAAGLPVSGGKVRVYIANTTNLATLYSDVGLSVSLSNPVVADSAGWASQIFLSDASNYDVATLTAGDVVLKTQDDVPAVGADGSSFSKDFTNSRAQIRGSAGTVYIEAGDPSPDNSGGKMRLGGWAGTQADTATIDAVATTVTGSLTAQSLVVGSTALDNVAATGTATNQASVVIPLTGGGRRYRLELTNCKVLTATQTFRLQVSYDSGANYKAGAADYGWSGFLSSSSGLTNENNTGTTFLQVSTVGMATTDPGAGLIDIIAPASSTGSFPTWIDVRWATDTGVGPNNYLRNVMGRVGPTYGLPTTLKIYSSSGNVSFEWRLIRMYGFT